MNRLLPIVFALLLVPTAQAGLFSDPPLEVVVGDAHAGTYYRFEERTEVRSAEGVETSDEVVLVHIEESPEANAQRGFRMHDRFGIERPVDVYRMERLEDGKVTSAHRCYALQGSSDAVRRDWLPVSGTGAARGDTSTGASTQTAVLGTQSRSWTSRSMGVFSTAPCDARPLPKMTFTEGDRHPVALFVPEARHEDAVVVSEPSVETTHFSYPALTYRFDVTPIFSADGPGGGTVSVTVAHLSAVVVKLEYDVWTEDPDEGRVEMRGVREFTGFRGGDGYVLPAIDPDVRLPVRNPAGEFGVHDLLVLDDAALALVYPYKDAMAAIRNDPTTGFAQWLGDGEGVRLVSAEYDRRMRTTAAPNAETDGGWVLLFHREEGEWFSIRSVRLAQPEDLPIEAPAKPVHNTRMSMSDDMLPPNPPQEEASSATVARVAEAHGLPPGSIQHLSYNMHSEGENPGHSALVLSDVSFSGRENAQGHILWIDLHAGALTDLYDLVTRADGDLVSVFPQNAALRQEAGAGALDVLVGPGFGENMNAYGAAAATGLAVIVVAAKFLLFPLFTRLRRDRLLDNPVRARLFEQVRREPGIHRAQLVEFAAIGEGATRHHLQQLVRHRLLVELQQEGFVRYFASGEVPPAVARREAALRRGSARRVYELYRMQPDITLRQAAAQLEMSAPSVHRVKRRLEGAGLLPAAAETSAEPALA